MTAQVVTRGLATANISRQGVGVTKKWPGERVWVDPVNIFLSSSLIAVQHLLAVWHTVLTKKNLGEGEGDTDTLIE